MQSLYAKQLVAFSGRHKLRDSYCKTTKQLYYDVSIGSIAVDFEWLSVLFQVFTVQQQNYFFDNPASLRKLWDFVILGFLVVSKSVPVRPSQ